MKLIRYYLYLAFNGLSYKSTIDGIGKDLQFIKIPAHKQPNGILKMIRISTDNKEPEPDKVQAITTTNAIPPTKEDTNLTEKKVSKYLRELPQN